MSRGKQWCQLLVPVFGQQNALPPAQAQNICKQDGGQHNTSRILPTSVLVGVTDKYEETQRSWKIEF